MFEDIDKEIEIEEEFKLTDLISINILQKMQESFAMMARMAAITTDMNGVAVTEETNFTSLCSEYCRKSSVGKARCEECDRMGAVMALNEKRPISYKCHANLVDFAAPIMLGNKMIGSIVGGQVLAAPPDEEEMRRVAREIGVDEEEFWAEANKVQIIPQAAIERSTSFIYDFARIISEMAYQTYVTMQLGKEAMQAAIQKQDFLANMSHEIRTPMNAVLGMAEMALREEMSNEAREYVSQIKASGKHLLAIINDILDFSKIDSGKMTVVDTIYETEELINDIANMVNSRIGEKPVEFIVEAPIDMPVELYGDYVRIQQVLVNLLTNAVKFTSRGYIKLRLMFENIDEENVLFKADVTDTGNGIKEDDLAKLFNSFQQVDSKRNRSVEGTGLGLAITKQLVELMGGQVAVTSEYGVGSTFSVQFPQRVQIRGREKRQFDRRRSVYYYITNEYGLNLVKNGLSKLNCDYYDLRQVDISSIGKDSFVIIERSDSVEQIMDLAAKLSGSIIIVIDEYDAPNDIKANNVRIIKKPIYGKKLLAALGLAEAYSRDQLSDDEIFSFVAPEARVLIVDDNSINLAVAKGLMEPLNMKVDTAISAMECLERIQANKYDLIFMDHMMPEVDGIETTHIIRRMYPDYADVPIIALTANAIAGAKEMFISEGMNDFVAKPIETKKIVAKVREWLPVHLAIPVDINERAIDDVAKENSIVEQINIPGLYVKEAIGLLRSEKLYLDFLKQYYSTIDEKIAKIENAFSNNDIKTYTIEVHALKSSSRQIGAKDLAAEAEKLEKAGNDNDLETIKNDTGKLLDDYRELKTKLDGLFKGDENEEEKKLSAELVEAISADIITALNEFDIVSIDESLKNIAQFSITREEELELLNSLKEKTEEFDIEVCQSLLEQWKAMY